MGGEKERRVVHVPGTRPTFPSNLFFGCAEFIEEERKKKNVHDYDDGGLMHQRPMITDFFRMLNIIPPKKTVQLFIFFFTFPPTKFEFFSFASHGGDLNVTRINLCKQE